MSSALFFASRKSSVFFAIARGKPGECVHVEQLGVGMGTDRLTL